jgi:hypothetical protein
MSKRHLVKAFGDAITQSFAQKLLGNYAGVSVDLPYSGSEP